MQINIDKKSGAFIAIIAALLTVIGVLAFNRADDGHMSGMGMHSDRTSTQESSEKFQGNDIMFAQMMIPHHQQAVEMSDLALKVSKNPDVLALAKQIRDAQAPEINQMKVWLDSSNMGMGMDHAMGGGGMLSDEEISKLKAATGSNFDQLFLEGMIAHHEGAIHMTLMIKNSNNSEVKTLGENIVSSQTAEIKRMKAMLEEM